MAEPSSRRPALLVAVLGTGTEVGKSWVSAAVLRELVGRGWSVSARKPAQSFDPDTSDGSGGEPHDSEVLAAATGESEADVCPAHRRYPVALAPPIAAVELGLPGFTIADLAREVEGSWGGLAADLGLVETAGGVASPAADDGHSGDLAAALTPEVIVLVADAALGAIHAVRSSLACCAPTAGAGTGTGAGTTIVHLNRFDTTARVQVLNRDWLRDRDGCRVTTDIDELADALEVLIPRHCAGCGRRTDACDGTCRRPLDPDRFCARCGRRTTVLVTPAGHRATCRVHGIVDDRH